MASLQEIWDRRLSQRERDLFLLASFFPAGTYIPIWLLGLAAGYGEAKMRSGPLRKACRHLQALGLFDSPTPTGQEVTLSSQQFGLIQATRIEGTILVADAAQRLLVACWTLDALKLRFMRVGYHVCKEQVQCISDYLGWLGFTEFSELVTQLEWWLSQEMILFTETSYDYARWSKILPDLFCQQLYNHSVEAGRPLILHKEPTRWLRLTKTVRAGASSRVVPTSTPDGPKVPGDSGTNRRWDVSNEHRYSEQKKTTRRGYRGVQFSVDGRLVFTNSPYGVRVWEVESGRKLRNLKDQEYKALSPDGRLILASTRDEAPHLWGTKSGQLLQRLDGRSIKDAMFSSDGRIVTVRSYNGTVRVWQVESGRMLRQMEGDKWKNATFSHDGHLALTWEHGQALLQLWEVESGQLQWQLQGEQWRHVGSGAFSPDGQLILITFGRMICLYEVKSGQELRRWRSHNHLITDIVFSPDGRLALINAGGGPVQLLWIYSRRLRQLKGYNRGVEDLTFSPDGRLAIVFGDDGRRLFFYRAHGRATGKLLGIYPLPQPIEALYWPNPKQIVVVDNVWQTGQPHFHYLTLEGEW